MSRTTASRTTRVLLVAAVAAIPVALASPASASTVISQADYSAGTLTIAGVGIWDRTITVDGVPMASTVGTGGSFTIKQTGYTPPADCTVDINDGSFQATNIRLNGCTPTVENVTVAPPSAPVS